MSKSALTVKIFGIYLLVLGASLVVAPNLLLPIFNIPRTSEVWIRVVGVLVFNIGIYYWSAAKCEAKQFFMASVFTRALVLASFISFVALGFAKPMLILIGSVDFLGGVWTLLALRAEQRKA